MPEYLLEAKKDGYHAVWANFEHEKAIHPGDMPEYKKLYKDILGDYQNALDLGNMVGLSIIVTKPNTSRLVKATDDRL